MHTKVIKSTKKLRGPIPDSDTQHHKRFHRSLRIFGMILFTLNCSPSIEAKTKAITEINPIVVVLDAGHGGSDHGANRGKIVESKITLDITKKLNALLADNPQFQVRLTRNDDTALSLEHRAEFARKENADLFISIHANSSEDTHARGIEFYVQNQLPADEESLFLASRENQNEGNTDSKPQVDKATLSDVRTIVEDLKHNYKLTASHELSQLFLKLWQTEHTRKNSRSIRQAPFYVISDINIPSVLVEVGYITHPEEGRLLLDSAYQQRIANNLFSGVLKFKEIMDKDRGKSLKSAHAL